jgi:hypothetical protein
MQEPPQAMDDPQADEAPPAGHGYGLASIGLYLQLVLQGGVSLRAACQVMQVVNQVLGLALDVPHWTTGRLWLLRLGHATLRAVKLPADDWAWLIDHSVQIGQEKCLVILGIRLADLPPPGQCLAHEDMELIELLPAKSWTRQQVDGALENAVDKAGHVPRVTVDDHGVDLHGGVVLFQQRHPTTAEIYDIKHKAACLLKHRLEKNPRWQAFATLLGQSRCAVQQTPLAFLTPPAPKPKARFMNLGRQLAWGRRVLAILRQPPAWLSASAEQLKQKLGWIEGFAPELIEWPQFQQVLEVAVSQINSQGIDRSAAKRLETQLGQLDALDQSAKELAAQMVRFVAEQAAGAKAGERLPGSTEVLESCFGKFKQLERQQSRGGFTQLLLGFGAVVARLVPQSLREALQASHTADVREWAAQNLGLTLFAQRKLAYAGATETG